MATKMEEPICMLMLGLTSVLKLKSRGYNTGCPEELGLQVPYQPGI